MTAFSGSMSGHVVISSAAIVKLDFRLRMPGFFDVECVFLWHLTFLVGMKLMVQNRKRN